MATPTARAIRPSRWSVAPSGLRRRVRRSTLLRSGELLQPTRRFEKLLPVDVRVPRDRREVGVSEVLGDESRVTQLLAQPGRGSVAQRVRGDVLLDPGALRGATDDVREDRLLQPPALEPAEDGVGRLGLSLGILTGDGSALTLAPELMPAAGDDLIVVTPADIESEAKARLFNAGWLGRQVHNMLDEVDRQLLCDGLLNFRTDPRKSVDSTGQALEDFLREIATRNGQAAEAKKMNGAGQLAALLVSKGLIHSHHQKLAEAVSTVRNATSHRKDKKTLAPWTITVHGAFATLAQTLTAIRSIGEYTTKGRQTI
jgi:hypothetical protein